MLAENVSEEQTVIVSTHVVFDFQNIVDGVIVLSHGRLVLSMPVWEITDRIAFVSDSMPPANALFMQQYLGRFNAIVPNDGTVQSDIDYVVFYNALQSANRDSVLNSLLN